MPTRERARLFHAAVVRAFARAHKHGGPCRAHFKNVAAKLAARAGLARRLADG